MPWLQAAIILKYLKIINLKTASLFSASTRVGACLSGSSEKERNILEFYGKNLGLAFQIADDALDYNSEDKMFGKKIGKDFLMLDKMYCSPCFDKYPMENDVFL